MHPYRPQTQWQYGYALAPTTTTDPNAAYASYYSQMYGAVPAAPQPPPPAPPQAPAAPAYTSDFSSGATGFTMPPPTTHYNYQQQRRSKYQSYESTTNQNLQEVQITGPPITSHPHPPPVQAKSAGSWQQYKQGSAVQTVVPIVPAAVQTPRTYRPPAVYPFKRFVKSQENRSSDDADDSPICQKVTDLAVYNKIKADYEKIDAEVSPGVYAFRLKLGTEVYTGAGSSFKLAKQSVATKALAATAYNRPMYKSTMKARNNGMTSTAELFEVATKKGHSPEFKFIEPPNFEYKAAMKQWTKDEMRGKYTVQLSVAGHTFYGEGDLPQSAKHNAAVQALPVLNQMTDVKPTASSSTGLNASGGKQDIATLGLLPNGKNVIMTLNEIAMLQSASIEWAMVDEHGPPHMRNYVWCMKMGSYEAKGTGLSKKVAKTMAAQMMYNTIPEEWKNLDPPGRKRKKPKSSGTSDEPAAKIAAKNPTTPGTAAAAPLFVPSVGRTGKNRGRGRPDKAEETSEPRPVHQVVSATNPISAIFEYCKKAKLADPEFEIVSETVMESRAMENKVFKKMEYTMKLTVSDKSFFASAFNKKAAKTAVAEEAWNTIKNGTMVFDEGLSIKRGKVNRIPNFHKRSTFNREKFKLQIYNPCTIKHEQSDRSPNFNSRRRTMFVPQHLFLSGCSELVLNTN